LFAFLSRFSARFSFKVLAGFFFSSFRLSCPFAIAMDFRFDINIKKNFLIEVAREWLLDPNSNLKRPSRFIMIGKRQKPISKQFIAAFWNLTFGI
jgi:hypothetical protein